MKSAFAASVFTLGALQAAAFPAVLKQLALDRRLTTPAAALSAARTNCGPTPCLVFDAAEQYVSTTGQYAYQSPTADQIRGMPVPSLLP